jgi:hypothetical protein
MPELLDSLEQINFAEAIEQAAAEDAEFFVESLDTRLQEFALPEMVEWCEDNIILQRTRKRVNLRPYQRMPVKVQLWPEVEEVYITGPEQFGKSITWQLPAVYKFRFVRGPKLLMYEENEKARDINHRRLEPMVKSIPYLRKIIEANGKAAKRGSYDLPTGYVDIQGAGADKTSQEYRDVFGDEVDTWRLPYSKKVAQVKNLQKRVRTYRESGEGGKLVLCSSSKGTDQDSVIWQYIKESSHHVFHLECQNCGGWINTTQIDSKINERGQKIGGLRWKLEKGIVIPDTVRLHCPECDHPHEQSESDIMAENGKYIPNNPDITDRLGFVFGGLSSSDCLRWPTIARERMDAASTNDFEVIRTFHNSFRGVAMPTRDERDQEAEAILRSRCIENPVTDQDIVCVLASADTQESPWGWYWVVRGIDRNHNSHLLKVGFAHTKESLETEICKTQYMGRKVDFAIIDQGGTNADDVKDLAKTYRHIWQYKGNTRQSELWKHSESQKQIKLILADAERFQLMLLRKMYDDENDKAHAWLLPTHDEFNDAPFVDDDNAFDYLINLLNVRDLGNTKTSHLRQKWDCHSHDRRDYFDCEKMMLVLQLVKKKEISDLVTHNGKSVKKKLSEIQREKRRK